MRSLIDEYPYNEKPVKHRGNRLEDVEDYLSQFWGLQALILSSARVGYYYALKFFGLTRFDHVFVPNFMCQAILNITNTSGFPVKRADEKTKAVLIFHQWGYPQKMEEVLPQAKARNLIVIEDCAHSFDSAYKGQKIGTFGEVAIYSFAKLFSTYLGGVLLSADAKLIEFVKQERDRRQGWENALFNFLAHEVAKKSFERGKWRFWLDAVYLKSIHFPNISQRTVRLLPESLELLQRQLLKRRDNYLTLKHQIRKDYLPIDWDEEIEVNPLLMPVFLPPQKLASASQILRARGILAEVLHFDVNRNVFEPNYQKCLAIPCHQAMSRQTLESMIELINHF